MKPPRALLLDCGNTLLEHGRVDVAAGFRAVLDMASHVPEGIDLDRVLAVAKDHAGHLNEVHDAHVEVPARHAQRLTWDRLSIRFDGTGTDRDRAFVAAAWATGAMPNVATALNAIAEHGVTLAVLSNFPFHSESLVDALAEHGLGGRFSFIMSTAEYHLRKPSPPVFLAAAGRLGLTPEEVWYVGDHLVCDVAGPQAVGMHAVWYNPDGMDPGEHRPDAIVTDWLEIPEIVRAALG